MPKIIKLTRTGGNYFGAIVFQFVFVGLLVIPVALALLLSIANPFWFRDNMFNWVEKTINRLSVWRNYTTYRIYLGCDPKMWHTLKGDM
jgi:hypothetical protein